MDTEHLITFSEAEQRFDLPRWCIRRWVHDGELTIEPDHQADDIRRLHSDDGLSMQAIADRLEVTKGLVQRRLAGSKRADMVRVDDLERLIAQQATCPGCEKPVESGRRWHPSCAAQQPGAGEKRAAAWTDEAKVAVKDRMAEYWSDEEHKAKAADRIRQRHEIWKAEVDSYRLAAGLLDVNHVAEKIPLSPSRVRQLAADHGIGVKVPGMGRGRLVFTTDDIEHLRGAIRIEPKHGRGRCVDCGKPTYNNTIRCKPHANEEKARRLNALHERHNENLAAFKRDKKFVDLDEAARDLNRSRTKTWQWARELGLGERVPAILGLPQRWLLSKSDVKQIRAAIKNSTAPGTAVREDPTGYVEWYRARFAADPNQTSVQRLHGAQGGRRSSGGGRKQTLTDEQKTEIQRLHSEQHSQRRIAELVGVSRRVVQYYLENAARTA